MFARGKTYSGLWISTQENFCALPPCEGFFSPALIHWELLCHMLINNWVSLFLPSELVIHSLLWFCDNLRLWWQTQTSWLSSVKIKENKPQTTNTTVEFHQAFVFTDMLTSSGFDCVPLLQGHLNITQTNDSGVKVDPWVPMSSPLQNVFVRRGNLILAQLNHCTSELNIFVRVCLLQKHSLSLTLEWTLH